MDIDNTVVENEATNDVSAQKQWRDMETMISTMQTQIKNISQQFRQLEKSNNKIISQYKKDANKSKGNKTPSGFAKPSKISKELCEFMGKEDGTEIARTEVTQYIITYIKDNNLSESKSIKPDKKLQELLGSTDQDKINYFNIQKYMNKHFIKG